MIGETVSHYRVLNELGRGGMGVVYLAEDEKLGRRVALKFLPPEAHRDDQATQRFIQEARTASALDHPNVCTIYEIGESQGRVFIAMAWYDGETLEQRLRGGRLGAREAGDVALQSARGLRKAHEALIVHRDIKPANLFLTRDGIVKILDFGIAKLTGRNALTRTGTTIGTCAYMSPEQIRGEEADARSDLWSLGVVLYEMLSGESPFRGEHEAATMYRVLNELPRPLLALAPDVPLGLETVVARLLKKDARSRYQSTAELVHDLEELAKETAPATTGPKPSATRHRAGATARARARPWLAPVAASLALLGAAGVYWNRGRMAPDVMALAILPFETAGADAEAQYLGEGLRDGLVARFSQIEQLKVKSRRAPLAPDEDVRTLGSTLKVDAIGTGRIVQRSDAVEIVVELIDATDGTIIWSRRYRRDALGLLAIEGEIVAEIANRLELKVPTDVEQRLVQPPTNNPDAHRLYLQGRYFWNRRSADGFAMAMQLYERALDLDPNYALAWAGLAGTHLMRFAWSIVPPQEAAQLARDAANRAIELDPTLAEPHAVLGYLKTLHDWDWDGAQREFVRAIELDSNYSTAHHWYAFLLATKGDMKGAIEEILLARDLEPESPIIVSEVGAFYLMDRQYERAIEELRAASVLDSKYESTVWSLVRAYGFLGRREEGRALAQTFLTTATDPVPLLYGGAALPLVGLDDEARAIYTKGVEASATTYVMPGLLGLLAAAIGDRDAAFAHFDRGLEERSLVLSWLRDPLVDGLRDDPRYARIFARVGLPP